MEIRISNCVSQTASVCPRYAFALVCASYFFKGMRLMAVAVAAKIDKNSLIPNKWAAETRCRACNGILQRSAVPTGARVHRNLLTYPDSPHFPITGGGKAVCAQTVRCHCGIYNVFGWEGGSICWGGGSGAMHGQGKSARFCCRFCFILGAQQVA